VIAAAVLALAVLALLWPEERLTTAGRLRAVLFAALAAVVGFVLMERQAGRAAAPATGRAFQSYTEGLINAKAAAASEWAARLGRDSSKDHGDTAVRRDTEEQKGKPAVPDARRLGEAISPLSPKRSSSDAAKQAAEMRRKALSSYAQAVQVAPEVARFRREYAILLADAGRREGSFSASRQAKRRYGSGCTAPGRRGRRSCRSSRRDCGPSGWVGSSTSCGAPSIGGWA
jgi:hypothetical protein